MRYLTVHKAVRLFEETMATLRYKPDWIFTHDPLVELPKESWYKRRCRKWTTTLRIDALVPEVGGVGTTILSSAAGLTFYDFMTPQDLRNEIRDFIIHVEKHEADEWISFGEERPYDPHKLV